MKPKRSRISAYAILHDSNHILLCRLSAVMTRWEGYWTLPGGGLNFGESPEAAAIREVEEETGLQIQITSIAAIDSIFDTSGIEDFHGIRVLYHAEVIGGALRDERAGSTDCCQWHALHPAPGIQLVDIAQRGICLAQQRCPSPLHGAQH